MKLNHLFFILLAGCNYPGAKAPTVKPDSGRVETRDTTIRSEPAPIAVVDFDCAVAGAAKISFWKDRCHIDAVLNGKTFALDLPQVISGSGARYSDGKHIVWNKGNAVMIDLGNGHRFHCSKRE